MVNCNPETVSTDYDTSRPALLRAAHARGRARRSSTRVAAGELAGVIVQFGGQTPLKLAGPLERRPASLARHPAPTRSTAPRIASGSTRCSTELGLVQPRAGIADERWKRRRAIADRDRLPGAGAPQRTCSAARAMMIVYDDRGSTRMRGLRRRGGAPASAVSQTAGAHRPVPRRTRSRSTSTRSATASGADHRRGDAAHRGGRRSLRRLGLRAPAATRSTRTWSPDHRGRTRRRSPSSSACVGLMNVQFAVTDRERLRARGEPARVSRTVPFVAKATGVPLAKLAAKVMVGDDARRSCGSEGRDRAPSAATSP